MTGALPPPIIAEMTGQVSLLSLEPFGAGAFFSHAVSRVGFKIHCPWLRTLNSAWLPASH